MKNQKLSLILFVSIIFIFFIGCSSSEKIIFNDNKITTDNINMNDYIEIVKYAAMAPSGHNTQPWIFEIHKNKIIIKPDKKRILPVVDYNDRELYISLGCALENLIIASSNYNYSANVSFIHKDNETNICVYLKEEIVQKSNLFEYISVRQCNRSEYKNIKLNDEIKKYLSTINCDPFTGYKLYSDSTVLDNIISLVKEGNNIQMNDEKFMTELKSWIRFNDSDTKENRDGLSSRCTGNPLVPKWLGKFLFGMFATANSQNSKDEKYIKSSSALAYFFSDKNDIESWINTGRTYERFVLNLAKLGLTSAFINQPCELKSLHEKLKQTCNVDKYPQLLIRIGFADTMPYSVRRDVKDVIVLSE